MTILIAGATGFLGSYLLKSFIDRGYKVIALKRTTSNSYRVDDYIDQASFYDIDKIEMAQVFEENEIDIVINTVTHYGRNDKSVSSIVETNLLFGLKLLEESVEQKVKAFINTDTLLAKNVNAYALSKSQLVDWMKILSSQNTKMVNIKIEHMYGLRDDENKFIYWLINQLKQNVKKIDLTSGIQKRDFIYIDDIVNAYQIIIENIDKLSNVEEFELGMGSSIKVKEFISKIQTELSKVHEISTKLNFGVVPYRANENMNMKADVSKLNSLGWKAKVSIKDGINKIINGENSND